MEQDNTDEREQLENDLIDAETVISDLRNQLRPLVLELREWEQRRRTCRARLDYYDFLEGVAHTFGPEIAEVVREQSQYAGVVSR